MARKSRKAANHTLVEEISQRRMVTGIYGRLSVTDNGYKESESIENQLEMLKDFLNRHEDEFLLQKTYVDNGATGTNFERPAWTELISDIKSGRINCIVVKDFSRLGRNYIEVGNYLEKIFPFLGVRVISLNDNFDSAVHQFNEKMLISSLTNIVNEYYARDISKKITQTKKTMQRNGEFVSSVLPYGYARSEENQKKLVLDMGASTIISKIFEWRVLGKGCSQIASFLNELLVPSPGLYRYMNGNENFKRCSNSKWKSKHVAAILVNPIYLGHMVQGKTRTSYFEDGGKTRFLPKEEWIIVENTHVAIVTQDQFDIVAKMADKSKTRYHEIQMVNSEVVKTENPFSKKIYCGQCGRLLIRRSRVKNGKRGYFFFCRSVQNTLDVQCKNTHIHEEPLLDAVRTSLIKQFEIAGEVHNKNRKKRLADRKMEEEGNNQKRIKELEERILFRKQMKQEMYADMRGGLITKTEYEYGIQKLANEIAVWAEEVQAILEKSKSHLEERQNVEEYQNLVFSLLDQELSVEMIRRLVDKIVVYSPEQIEMTFSFSKNEQVV